MAEKPARSSERAPARARVRARGLQLGQVHRSLEEVSSMGGLLGRQRWVLG